MRQFPPPSSSSQEIADEWDKFLRGFRLIRWELPLPPLHAHSEVALNWLLAGGRQTTNLFQRRVCALWPVVFTHHLRGTTAYCGLWLGAMVVDRAQIHTGIHPVALFTRRVRGMLGVFSPTHQPPWRPCLFRLVLNAPNGSQN